MSLFKNIVTMVVLSLLSASLYASNLLMAKPPEVTVNAIELLRWVERDLYVNMYFGVDNANDQDIPIKAVRYDMQVMGQTVAKDYRDLAVVLKANSLTEIKMPVKLDMMQLFSVMPDALLTNQFSYIVTGAVAVEGLILQLPFEKRGDLTLYGPRQ